MDEATGCAEYLCTLQPPKASALGQGLCSRRAACQQAGLEPDATGLYPPHVSVTGFFKATREQAAEICKIAAQDLAAVLSPVAQAPGDEGDGTADVVTECVEVRQVVTTEGGHVLLDVAAPLISGFAEALAAQAALVGVHIRPKAVKHLSLASGKSPEERASIARLHEDLLVGGGCWDFVVGRLLFRSDVEKLREGGTEHIFEDLLRLKLPCAAKAAGELTPRAALTSSMDAAAAAVAAAGFPLPAGLAQRAQYRNLCSPGGPGVNIDDRGTEESPRCRVNGAHADDVGHFASSVAKMQQQLSSLASGQDFDVRLSEPGVISTGQPKAGCLVARVADENSMLCAR